MIVAKTQALTSTLHLAKEDCNNFSFPTSIENYDGSRQVHRCVEFGSSPYWISAVDSAQAETMTGPGPVTAAQTSPIRNDLQHEITRHLMTAAARLQSLPIGKRLVLKIGEWLVLLLHVAIVAYPFVCRENRERSIYFREE